MGENFSFRWGIDILDGGFTDIPNFLLDHYASVGVKPREFMVIIHLARYQYERPDSESRPSLQTVARQMGYTVRNLRKILARLEERGLLARQYRPGKTTIYDFSGFSRRVLDAARQGETELQDTPEPQFRPPRNWGSAEQQQGKQNPNNNTDGVGDFSEGENVVALLTALGVTPSVARDLAQSCSPDHIQGWISYAQSTSGVHNPPGFVIDALRKGDPPPSLPAALAPEAPGGVFQ